MRTYIDGIHPPWDFPLSMPVAGVPEFTLVSTAGWLVPALVHHSRGLRHRDRAGPGPDAPALRGHLHRRAVRNRPRPLIIHPAIRAKTAARSSTGSGRPARRVSPNNGVRLSGSWSGPCTCLRARSTAGGRRPRVTPPCPNSAAVRNLSDWRRQRIVWLRRHPPGDS
jgi:hypothetical protein